MSGHSKWSKIKRKKGVADAKKGKAFSKVIREITVASRVGGQDPDGNPRLKVAIDKARAVNMPFDNIERAIQKGAGGGEGQGLEEFTLEGYGPAGVAVLVEAFSDNHNRTVAEVRHLFHKMGGNLGEAGCVGWLFTKRGSILFSKTVNEEKLLEAALEAGALDIQATDDGFEVITTPHDLSKIRSALTTKGLPSTEAAFQMIPQNTIHLEGNNAEKMVRLLEALEDHDDIQNVTANFDIDESVLEKLAS